ncbi:hypothetical protein BH11VER1_BH11VER1_03280 [soil metagenome]
MNENSLKLTAAPIVEAVVDIECDMPPKFDLVALEDAAREAYQDKYPLFHMQYLEQHQIEQRPDEPTKHTTKRGIQALQFHQTDKKQLIQVRSHGYSFNRLAPYSTLDHYLNEIERTWRLFVGFAAPVQIRAVRLRYINRILLPMDGGNLKLTDYLRVSPQLPDESNLTFVGFLNQHTAVETGTGNQANIVLTTQLPEEDELPIIFDIGVNHMKICEVENWPCILEAILSLRSLKNRIFENTLTKPCLNLFR